MQRLIARFLLLFTLVGTFVPLALAVSATPPHACCVRKIAHQCHGSARPESDHPAVGNANCCSHDCCRGVNTSKSAHPENFLSSVLALYVDARVPDLRFETPVTEAIASKPARAPPQVSIA